VGLYTTVGALQLYRVAHKKWTILFCCLQRIYHKHTENFCNISTVPKTLIEMLFNMSTLCCNNWTQQSFLKLSDCSIRMKSVRRKHVYLWHREWRRKEYSVWTILQRILIFYHLQVLSLASTFYNKENIVEQQFMLIDVHILHGGPLFLHHSVCSVGYGKQYVYYALLTTYELICVGVNKICECFGIDREEYLFSYVIIQRVCCSWLS